MTSAAGCWFHVFIRFFNTSFKNSMVFYCWFQKIFSCFHFFKHSVCLFVWIYVYEFPSYLRNCSLMADLFCWWGTYQHDCLDPQFLLQLTMATIYLVGGFNYSPPARWGLLDFIRAVVLLLLLRLLLQFLLDHVCINFHLHFRLANSSPSSSPTSQLSAHCWTSTWDLPSSVRTAGPQPGTFPAQCAPLDLNLGPSQLSAHRWTSTWDLPSSVRTAGPQPGTFHMPDRMPDKMPDRMPEGMPDRMSDRMSEGMPDKVPECLPEHMPEDLPDRMSEDMLEDMPDRVPEDMPGRMPEDMPDRMPEDMPDKMPEDMSDRMPEDLPVTKRIDVMVGITRSKVIWYFQR